MTNKTTIDDAIIALEGMLNCWAKGKSSNNEIAKARQAIKALRKMQEERAVDMEKVAEEVFNYHEYGMAGTWKGMKDKWIGDDKPDNCWKPVHSKCLGIARHLVAKGYLKTTDTITVKKSYVPDGLGNAIFRCENRSVFKDWLISDIEKIIKAASLLVGD